MPTRCSRWISKKSRLKLYDRDGWTCRLQISDKCAGDLRALYEIDAQQVTLDHIISWKVWWQRYGNMKGVNHPSNLQMSCLSCNSKKGAKVAKNTRRKKAK